MNNNTNPRVSDNYFLNQKFRGHSLRLDLYVYEWKHILQRYSLLKFWQVIFWVIATVYDRTDSDYITSLKDPDR